MTHKVTKRLNYLPAIIEAIRLYNGCWTKGPEVNEPRSTSHTHTHNPVSLTLLERDINENLNINVVQFFNNSISYVHMTVLMKQLTIKRLF